MCIDVLKSDYYSLFCALPLRASQSSFLYVYLIHNIILKAEEIYLVKVVDLVMHITGALYIPYKYKTRLYRVIHFAVITYRGRWSRLDVWLMCQVSPRRRKKINKNKPYIYIRFVVKEYRLVERK